MARLDAEQQVARQPRQQQRMAPDEVVAYLRSLPDAVERRRTRRTPGTGLGAVHQARSGGLYEDAIRTHTRCRYPRSRRSPTGADGDRWSHRWVWSGREDLNLRPQRPERCALPNCATPRLKGPSRHSRPRGIGIIGQLAQAFPSPGRAVGMPLGMYPFGWIAVPRMAPVGHLSDRRLDQLAALLVVQGALHGRSDEAAATSGAHASIEASDISLVKSDVCSHGHTLAHNSGDSQRCRQPREASTERVASTRLRSRPAW